MLHQPSVSRLDGLPVRLSGPWIRQKYFYLRRYIDIFTGGMKRKWSSLGYIDLFAGPGRCFIPEEDAEIEGSVLIAVQEGFQDYIFVEKERGLMEALKKRCAKSPKRGTMSFQTGDCNPLAGRIRSKMKDQTLHLIFSDPTGIDLHFQTLETLTSGTKSDLLLNIQFGMDIVRNFDRYREQGDASPLGLFLGGNVDWEKLNGPRDVIELYKKRIEGLGYRTVRYQDKEIRNRRNVSMYFLLFASRHSRGLEFWRNITRKDPQGQLEFL